jgi:hypothetical protein
LQSTTLLHLRVEFMHWMASLQAHVFVGQFKQVVRVININSKIVVAHKYGLKSILSSFISN